MNYKKQKVIDSLKWKKHPKISAQRLGMSEDEYIKIKQEVLQERKLIFLAKQLTTLSWLSQ